MTNPSDSEKGIIRLCVATKNDSTTVNSLETYIDDFEIYETVNAPVVTLCDMAQPEINADASYANVYVLDSITNIKPLVEAVLITFK